MMLTRLALTVLACSLGFGASWAIAGGGGCDHGCKTGTTETGTFTAITQPPATITVTQTTPVVTVTTPAQTVTTPAQTIVQTVPSSVVTVTQTVTTKAKPPVKHKTKKKKKRVVKGKQSKPQVRRAGGVTG